MLKTRLTEDKETESATQSLLMLAPLVLGTGLPKPKCSSTNFSAIYQRKGINMKKKI